MDGRTRARACVTLWRATLPPTVAVAGTFLRSKRDAKSFERIVDEGWKPKYENELLNCEKKSVYAVPQGCSKRRAWGWVKMRWKNCIFSLQLSSNTKMQLVNWIPWGVLWQYLRYWIRNESGSDTFYFAYLHINLLSVWWTDVVIYKECTRKCGLVFFSLFLSRVSG